MRCRYYYCCCGFCYYIYFLLLLVQSLASSSHVRNHIVYYQRSELVWFNLLLFSIFCILVCMIRSFRCENKIGIHLPSPPPPPPPSIDKNYDKYAPTLRVLLLDDFKRKSTIFVFSHSSTKSFIQLLWFRFVQRILKWFDSWHFSFGVEIKRKCHYIFAFCNFQTRKNKQKKNAQLPETSQPNGQLSHSIFFFGFGFGFFLSFFWDDEWTRTKVSYIS